MKLTQVFAIVLAVGSGGCSVLDGVALAPKYNPYTYYLTSPQPVYVRTDYMDRYACAAETPLVCECVGRVSSECLCRC